MMGMMIITPMIMMMGVMIMMGNGGTHAWPAGRRAALVQGCFCVAGLQGFGRLKERSRDIRVAGTGSCYGAISWMRGIRDVVRRSRACEAEPPDDRANDLAALVA